MKTVGFPISKKENENRRVLIPKHIINIKHPENLYFEENYGKVLGYSDDDYLEVGVNITSRTEVLTKDIICDPKIGDAEYLGQLNGQTIFGWVHATQNRDITDEIVNNKLTAFAWENMHYKGRHIFWRNNELAGEAAVLHAFQFLGSMPYETTVAIIGRGNTARGAFKILSKLGANIEQFDRKSESLFKEDLGKYDVVVNCVLWDVLREDHIISRDDLKRMKPNSMIIDVSCDRNGGIESSIPTTIEDPIYYVDGIRHYVVDHTPSIFHKTFTNNNSEIVFDYINQLMLDETSPELNSALIIDNGVIIDEEINKFQNR